MSTKPLFSHSLRLASLLLLVIFVLPLAPARAQAFITDIATDETDPCHHRDAEPSIAVNPQNPSEIAVLSFAEVWGLKRCSWLGGTLKAPVWMSKDGGATWSKSPLIGPPPSELPGPYDQKVAYDAAGNLIITVMDRQLNDFIYSRRGDPQADLFVGQPYGKDQPQLEVDINPSSKCFNRVYSPWNRTSDPSDALLRPLSMVSFSADGGASMTHKAIGDDSHPNRSARAAVAADGSVYMIFKMELGGVDDRFGRARFKVKRSDDCGETWDALGVAGIEIQGAEEVQTWSSDPSCADDTAVGFGGHSVGKGGHRKFNRAMSSDAWIAVAPDETVYAAFVKKNGSGFGQIYVARSTDQGATWALFPASDGRQHAAFPALAVAANGTVGLSYVDFELSETNNPIFRHHFSRSFNQGTDWADQVLQVLDLDALDIHNYVCSFIWGDYGGLTAHGNTFYGVFTGQSIGRARKELDPIFFRETALPPAEGGNSQSATPRPAMVDPRVVATRR